MKGIALLWAIMLIPPLRDDTAPPTGAGATNAEAQAMSAVNDATVTFMMTAVARLLRKMGSGDKPRRRPVVYLGEIMRFKLQRRYSQGARKRRLGDAM